MSNQRVQATEIEPSEFLLLRDQKMTEEDRKEILESIEKVAAENRIPADEALFRITPLKKGFFFPLAINLLAAVAVVAGFVGSNLYFSRKQAAISSQAGTFFSAEGKLVEQVRKESAAKLKAKDEEISAVKAKLATLNKESAALHANMQATIQAKEQELRQQMQSQLAGERARLQKLGISQDEVNARLQAFEVQKNAQFAEQLNQYKQQSQAALSQKEQQIRAQQAQNQQILDQANRERQQLVQQAKKQEEQLRARYEAQTQQLQSANQQLQAQSTAAQQKLQALAVQSQNEQLVSDQIAGSYNAVLQDIQQARYDQANTDIASLQTLLNSSAVSSLPNLAKRRPVDLQLLQSLKELIKARTQPGQPLVDPKVIERSNQVEAAGKLVAEGESAQKRGSGTDAEDLFTKAIAQIPVVERAHSALMTLFKKQSSDAIAQREAAISRLEAQSSAKSDRIAELTKNLSETRTTLESARTKVTALQKQVADQAARIDDLGREVAARRASSEALQKRVADQSAQLSDLTSRLAEANSSLNDLKQKLAASGSRVADLEKQLASQKEAAGGSQKQVAAQAAATAGYRQELNAAKETNATLKKKLADNEAEIARMSTDLKTAQSKIDSLQNNVTGVMDTFASIQNKYSDYRGQLVGLVDSGRPQDIAKARALLLQFIAGSGVDRVLPGFSQVTRQVTEASAKTAEDAGVAAGRKAALNDVMKVTNYYSASTAASATGSATGATNTKAEAVARAEIDKKAATDPLFRQTAEDIQKLAEQSGKAAGRQSLAVNDQLIGTISFISSKSATVEKLVNVPVPEGSTVSIRHKTDQGEVPVAEGTVTGQSSDSVQVTIGSLLQGNTVPQLLDVVYLQPKTGA